MPSAESAPTEETASSRRRRWALLFLLLLVAAVIVLFALLRRPGPAAADLLAELLALRSELEGPGLTVPEASAKLGDAEAALRFVRDDIRYLDYRGRWSGAEGSLRVGAANGADKAVLLSALLQALGYETRYRVAGWPADESGVPARPAGADGGDWQPTVQTRLARLHALLAGVAAEDPRPAAPALDAQSLQRSLHRQSEALAAMIPADWMAVVPTPVAAAAVEERWIWVEARPVGSADDQAWADFDPLFGALARPDQSELVPEPVPVAMSLSVEMVDRQGQTQRLSAWSGLSEEAVGQDMHYITLPALHHADDLDRIADPANVDLWRSMLRVGDQRDLSGAFSRDGAVLRRDGDRVLAGRGVLFDASLSTAERFAAVPLRQARILRTDASRYPIIEVDVGLVPEGSQPGRWHPAHFALSPGAGLHGAAGVPERLATRIELAQAEPWPIYLLADRSGSMEYALDQDEYAIPDRISIAQEAMRRLVGQLTPGQEIGLYSFNAYLQANSEAQPVGDGSTITAAIDGIGCGGNTWIPEAIMGTLDAVGDRPCYLLLLSDGIDSRLADGDVAYKPAAEAVRVRLADVHARWGSEFIAIGLGGADDLQLQEFATVAKGRYTRISSAAELNTLYEDLGRQLSGRARIAFRDPLARPADGTVERQAELRIAGFDEPLSVAWTVPAAGLGPARSLRLTVRFSERGRPPLIMERQLQALGPDSDAWNLVGDHHLLLTMGPVPQRVRAARLVDELIEQLRFEQLDDGEIEVMPELACERGMTADLAGYSNTVLATLDRLAREAELPLARRGPQLLALSQRGRQAEDGRVHRQTGLDVLACAWGAAPSATRRQRIQIGLAVGAGEAQALANSDPSSTLAGAEDRVREERAGDWHIRAASVPAVSWVLPSDGELRVQVAHAGQGEAKGNTVEDIGRVFRNLRLAYKAISAGFSATNDPRGAVFSAFIALLQENMKLWCFATTMMAQLNESIGKDFDVAAARERSARVCETSADAKEQGVSVVTGMIGGAAGSKVNDALTKPFQQFMPGWAHPFDNAWNDWQNPHSEGVQNGLNKLYRDFMQRRSARSR